MSGRCPKLTMRFVQRYQIKVVDAHQQEVFFKIKNTTKLGKLMDAYAERAGKAKDAVRFLYDGQRWVSRPSL